MKSLGGDSTTAGRNNLLPGDLGNLRKGISSLCIEMILCVPVGCGDIDMLGGIHVVNCSTAGEPDSVTSGDCQARVASAEICNSI
ncbi:hypothetical protein RRG08_008021 [Elysia crispata]|uniref:Uncharacterized protein n=1 Tax=Elysia crispata TaxID=231223 RepID=A0AAE0YT73_9GAST|nr:hypothetical protein RRG08_008021 [Elysia crispata]